MNLAEHFRVRAPGPTSQVLECLLIDHQSCPLMPHHPLHFTVYLMLLHPPLQQLTIETLENLT